MEQILVGTLQSPSVVELEDGTQADLPVWRKRAKWSYLRLVHGRKIDAEIKRKGLGFFDENHTPNSKPLQFIVIDGKVRAVATQKHLLIPPEVVYQTAEKIIGVPLLDVEGMYGKVDFIREVAGLKVGFQINGGTITTRNAIRIGSFIRVELCFNPLSWLNVSGLQRFGLNTGNFERVLRIERLRELEPRLKEAIKRAEDNQHSVFNRVKQSRKVSVSAKEMRVIMSAMGLSYGLGKKTIKTVFDRFKDEPKTLWGLAMASSWIAGHGEFRKTPKGQTDHTKQKLSTISGACLLIDDKKEAVDKGLGWLKERVKSGKLKKLSDLIKA